MWCSLCVCVHSTIYSPSLIYDVRALIAFFAVCLCKSNTWNDRGSIRWEARTRTRLHGCVCVCVSICCWVFFFHIISLHNVTQTHTDAYRPSTLGAHSRCLLTLVFSLTICTHRHGDTLANVIGDITQTLSIQLSLGHSEQVSSSSAEKKRAQLIRLCMCM